MPIDPVRKLRLKFIDERRKEADWEGGGNSIAGRLRLLGGDLPVLQIQNRVDAIGNGSSGSKWSSGVVE